jgi:hypothetical protein
MEKYYHSTAINRCKLRFLTLGMETSGKISCMGVKDMHNLNPDCLLCLARSLLFFNAKELHLSNCFHA